MDSAGFAGEAGTRYALHPATPHLNLQALRASHSPMPYPVIPKGAWPRALHAALVAVGCLCLVAACSRTEPQDYIVQGNTPPAYNGVSTAELNVYATKVYIDLLGRGPTSGEREAFVQEWRDRAGTGEGIDALLTSIQQTGAAYRNLDLSFREKFLNGTDSVVVAERIAITQNTYDNLLSTGDTLTALFVAELLAQYQDLQNALDDLRSGQIDWSQYVVRHLNNGVFTEINMGSENYALACFEDLFFRQPTTYELDASVSMIDGTGAFLFLEYGDSRADFNRIVTSGGPFSEALALEVFTALLGRRPETAELGTALDILGAENDLLRLQRHLLQLPAYAGF